MLSIQFSSNITLFLLLILTSLTSINAFDALGKTNNVIYWGQNSAQNQQNLAYYCTDSVDIIILSFMNIFPNGQDGNPGLNFANACETPFPDNSLLHCPTIADDIKTCQSRGKKILLSLGGASGSYGFSSNDEAIAFAGTLWNLFGEGKGDSLRPFDDAIIDGFDLDIENNQQTGYVALVSKLREYFKSSTKQYFIGAAPQCVYPDANLSEVLDQSDIDWVFVQFYNNYCSIGSGFNWDTWSDYAKTSPNKNIRIYLGLPGSLSAASSGYIPPSTIKETVEKISSDPYFGGIMLWDASQAFTNNEGGEPFADQIKDILLSTKGNPSPSSSYSASSYSASSYSASSSHSPSSYSPYSSYAPSSYIPLSSSNARIPSVSSTNYLSTATNTFTSYSTERTTTLTSTVTTTITLSRSSTITVSSSSTITVSSSSTIVVSSSSTLIPTTNVTDSISSTSTTLPTSDITRYSSSSLTSVSSSISESSTQIPSPSVSTSSFSTFIPTTMGKIESTSQFSNSTYFFPSITSTISSISFTSTETTHIEPLSSDVKPVSFTSTETTHIQPLSSDVKPVSSSYTFSNYDTSILTKTPMTKGIYISTTSEYTSTGSNIEPTSDFKEDYDTSILTKTPMTKGIYISTTSEYASTGSNIEPTSDFKEGEQSIPPIITDDSTATTTAAPHITTIFTKKITNSISTITTTFTEIDVNTEKATTTSAPSFSLATGTESTSIKKDINTSDILISYSATTFTTTTSFASATSVVTITLTMPVAPTSSNIPTTTSTIPPSINNSPSPIINLPSPTSTLEIDISYYHDCSDKKGEEKVTCLNNNFISGFYLGGDDPNSCVEEGSLACSGSGEFAMCNFEKWVKFQCPLGTACYASTIDNKIINIGCNYI